MRVTHSTLFDANGCRIKTDCNESGYMDQKRYRFLSELFWLQSSLLLVEKKMFLQVCIGFFYSQMKRFLIKQIKVWFTTQVSTRKKHFNHTH